MSELFVEPFCGEFGYELIGWQSVLRAMKYDQVEVWCRPGHNVLYRDFAKVHNFDPRTTEVNCHQSKNGVPFVRPKEGNWLAVNDVYVNGWSTLFDGTLKHEYIEFGSPISPAYTLIHARATDKFKTGYRNWPVENWEKLVPHLTGFVASIGTTESAYHISNTADLRGLTLHTLCDYMAGASVVIGPSSGPMHLAALCGCPHLVWTGHKRTVERCEGSWNPFQTKCLTHFNKFEWDTRREWQPEPETIVELLRGFDATLVRS